MSDHGKSLNSGESSASWLPAVQGILGDAPDEGNDLVVCRLVHGLCSSWSHLPGIIGFAASAGGVLGGLAPRVFEHTRPPSLRALQALGPVAAPASGTCQSVPSKHSQRNVLNNGPTNRPATP